MSTVMTSIEWPLTEPELADLGKQQARLLQDIGELIMQKKVAVDEFKERSVKSRSRSRNSPHASIWAWIGRKSSAISCSIHPRKGGRVSLPSKLGRSSKSRRWRSLIIRAAYSMRTSVPMTNRDSVHRNRCNFRNRK